MNRFAEIVAEVFGSRTDERMGRHVRPVRQRVHSRSFRAVAAATSFAVVATLGLSTVSFSAAAAPVGQGFNVDARDLAFILKQIKIAERHVETATAENPCGTLLGDGPDQIPNVGQGVELPWGLRTVDGTCNNLIEGQEYFGAAGKEFPRHADPVFAAAEAGDPDGPGPSPSGSTSYAQTGGVVFDSQPRLISNLIVDQTAGNPAAVEAAGENPTVSPSGAFAIPNVAPDVGLSAPFNSWFTLFGQFFDHGLDLTSKGGRGSIFIPLKSDDPLFDDGPNNIAGDGDDGPNFMVLTRATTGADGRSINQTSSFVDQSQTYTSHPSHQVFLRQYADDAVGDPQSTGALITGPGGGMATWNDVKEQAQTVLGIALTDADALSVPLLATDAYGRFTRGPNGFPQIVRTGNVLAEGDPAAAISTVNAIPSGVGFLDDIAHHAVPVGDPDGQGPLPRGPLAPDGDSGTTDDNDPATYDDEMLGAHFIAGDGRVNENIGLTTVHHVFHSEHNRLVDESDTDDPSDLKTVIRNHVIDSAAAGTTPMFTLADWQRADGQWDGERLFQAARFVTEMEYQHLAFEEFIRKVQPMVNLFGEGGTGYNTSINPSIRGEFANAVYRFGHSMLPESIDRVSLTGARSDIPLLDAFLNPPSFMTGTQTPEQAAGNIVRGMTRQVGNEIDEFVTEAVRNELLGLPLDLPALNMARARETGTPTLNAARRMFYASTNNSALTPYESWVDLNFNLKHSASLVNFVAAYGTHSTITGQSTLAGKRNAAVALVHGEAGADSQLLDDPATPANEAADNPTGDIPADREDFLNSTGAYVSGANGVTTTGVDTIDLWMGGLAEKQAVFGGVLGSTFNHVFEQQMEDLQNGDRFYYLSRTVSLNMLTQLEGNSFAELIQRNTDVSGLPADSFSRPDLVFNVGALGTSGAILDDPATTEYNESTMLIRTPNGTIRYGGPAHVVFNGTAGNDRVWASEGDDTIRGDDGNDWMQGGDGNDNHIGGLGDDILLDLAGDDTLKGGDGNDVLSSGQGFGGDLNQSGRGNDFVVGGNDITETFAGHGDDFVFAGDADDTVFGDEGNDWLEAGKGNFNLIQGDNGAPFQDDATGGHDVLIGYGGEQDYDSEGGDDVMLAGPGIQRSEGMLGFDWVTHKADPTAARSDMDITGLLPPSIETNLDRFDLVESLSGWDKNDDLRGDSRVATDLVGHELNQAGIARINGLAGLLPAGAASFTGGNIIIGGAGSDRIEGRGGDDILDGDAYLNVRISVRDAGGAEIETVDTMAGVQARVLAGTINPGQLRIVREILTPANGTAVDTAAFTGPEANYTVTTAGGDGTLGSPGSTTTVVDTVGTDGTDTLRNVEGLVFSDTVTPVTPSAPIIGAAVAGDASATVNFTAPTTGIATSFSVRVVDAAGTQVGALRTAGAGATSLLVTGLANGTAVRFQVSATNATGTSAFSALSNAVTPTAAAVLVVQGAARIGAVVAGNAQVTVNWLAPLPVANAAPVTGYRIRTFVGGSTTAFRTTTVGDVTSSVIGTLVNGTGYQFDVAAINSAGTGPASARSTTATPVVSTVTTVPAAPTIGTPTAGNASVTVRWTAPASNGGSAVTGYRIRTFVGTSTTVFRTTTVGNVTSAVIGTLANGTGYSFNVAAINAVGTGAVSARSATVTPRVTTLPGAPTIGTPSAGNASATVRWSAPASNGGSAITGYRVRAMTGGGAVVARTQTFTGSNLTSGVVTGLTNGTAYSFDVAAINAVGTGPRSARSATVTPRAATVPAAPRIGTPSAGNRSATVRWSIPANGGSPITGYRVRVMTGGGAVVVRTQSVTGNVSSVVVTGLTNGTAYSFDVAAVNAIGTGPRSARSATVTPR